MSRMKPRIRIRIRTSIRIRIFVSKAKRQIDIKIKAARLVWPGGMSGAPEFTDVFLFLAFRTGGNQI